MMLIHIKKTGTPVFSCPVYKVRCSFWFADTENPLFSGLLNVVVAADKRNSSKQLKCFIINFCEL